MYKNLPQEIVNKVYKNYKANQDPKGVAVYMKDQNGQVVAIYNDGTSKVVAH